MVILVKILCGSSLIEKFAEDKKTAVKSARLPRLYTAIGVVNHCEYITLG
jgi:hypothetical protein